MSSGLIPTERAKNLFHEARVLSAPERTEFLRRQCGDEPSLFAEVHAMLDDYERIPPGFLDAKPLLKDITLAPAAAEITDLSDKQIGRYKMLRLLGKGGMGQVWQACDTKLKHEVAIKILPYEFAREADRLQRFQVEAQVILTLKHQNIVFLYDIDKVTTEQGELHYFVMELIEGQTLRQRLNEQGRLPWRTAVNIARQIAAALEAAHGKDGKGVIHRDIKPENIMLRPDSSEGDFVKVLDFGLAKSTGNPETDFSLTQSGAALGTPRYMSPEQVRGQEVTAQTDLFSLGTVLYEMLTGQPPFAGNNHVEVGAAILKEEPAELSELSATSPEINAQLRLIVQHCLEKKPERRFQTARDLGFALEAVVTSSGQPLGKGLASKGRKRLGWRVTAVLGLLGLLGFAAAYFRPVPVAHPLAYSYLPLPLKTSSAINHGSALSPDGRHAIIVALTEEVPRLWLYSFDKSEPILLPGTEEAHYPFWSPNSQSIGFFAQGQLKRIEITGGIPTTLCAVSGPSGGIGGAWSNSGVILFALQFNGAGLYQVAEAGGTATPVTSLDESRFETGHNFPQFLPDGRHFIFFTQAGHPDYRGIRLGSLDQTPTRFLLRADTKAEYSAAGYLLFVKGRKIQAQRFDTTRFTLSGEAVPITDQVHYEPPYRYTDLSVVNGQMLLYRGGGNLNTQLVWLDRQGRQLAAIGPASEYHSVQLSPAGDQALLDRNDPQTETSDIWQLDLVRGSRKRLTSNPAPDTYPLWSPDGNRIAFVSNRQGFWGIYQKGVNSDDQEELLLKGAQELLLTSDWSSDGKFIVYRKYQQTGIDLELLPLAGDHQSLTYLATPFDESYGQVSPDGRWLAYQSDNSGRMEINVQSFPQPGRGITVSHGGGILPRWRGDGKELYYVAADDKLMAVPVDTGAQFSAGVPMPLFELGSFGRVIGRYVYDVSADGQKFLVLRPLEDASLRPLTVVRNWTDLLKQ